MSSLHFLIGILIFTLMSGTVVGNSATGFDSIEEDLVGGLEDLLEELDSEGEGYAEVVVDDGIVLMKDVPRSTWFFEPIQLLADLDIVSGYKDAEGNLTGFYKPGNNVTYAEAIKIAIGSAGIDPFSCGEPSFASAKSHWAAAYVACAEQHHFGISETIDFDAPASRAEVLHYFLMAFDAVVAEGIPPFEDSKEHRLKNDIALAFSLKIITGDTHADGSSKGTFRPDEKINRAEMAKMAQRLMELL